MQQPSKKKNTIYVIANLAQVSPSTVSRALQHPGRLAPQTEERIRKVAAEIGYTRYLPNNNASKTDSKIIAIIVNDTDSQGTMEWVQSAQHRLASRGYHSLLCEEADVCSHDGFSSSFNNLNIKGALAETRFVRDGELKLLASRLPLILINRKASRCTSVCIDTSDAARTLISHLHDLGHHSLTFMSSANDSSEARQLHEQLPQNAKALSMEYYTLPNCGTTINDGVNNLNKFLQHPTSAIFATSADMALGLLAAASKQGLSVPQDFSIIGLGQSKYEELITPSLTSIVEPDEELGRVSAEALITLIQHQNKPWQDSTLLPAALVEKSSLGPQESQNKAALPQIVKINTNTKPLTLSLMTSSLRDWEDRIDAYMRLHPDIKIHSIEAGSPQQTVATYLRKFRNDDEIPDLLVTEYRNISQLADEKILLDLSNPQLEAAIKPQLIKSGWDSVSYRDGIYGIPYDYDTSAMFYRVDVFDRLGIDPPRTWDDLLTEGIELHKKCPSVSMTSLDALNSVDYFSLFYMNNAIPWSTDKRGNHISLRLCTAKSRQTAAFIQELIDANVLCFLSYVTSDFSRKMHNGEIATVIHANWFAENLSTMCPDDAGLWKVDIPPSFSAPSSLLTTRYGGSALSISSKIPLDKKEAALQLACWLETDTRAVSLERSRVLSASKQFHRNPEKLRMVDPYFRQQLYPVFFESAELINPQFQYMPFTQQIDAIFDTTILPHLIPGGNSQNQLESLQNQIASYARFRGFDVSIE